MKSPHALLCCCSPFSFSFVGVGSRRGQFQWYLYEAPNSARFSQSLKPRWLSGRCQNGGPPDAVGVDVFLFTDQHLDRDMDK